MPPAAADGFTDDLDGLHDAAQGRGVRGKDDRVARLDGDLRLVEAGGRWVRGGDQARDHADRNGIDAILELIVVRQLADGLHVLDILVDTLAGEDVLHDLVFDRAEVRLFLVGHLRQTLCVADARVRNGLDDFVDLFLVHQGDLTLRLLGGGDEISCLWMDSRSLSFNCIAISPIGRNI